MTYTRDSPSPAFRELQQIYADIHADGLPDAGIEPGRLFDGHSIYPHVDDVRALARATGARTVLDYGSGKGMQYRQDPIAIGKGREIPGLATYWGVEAIHCYDPGVPEYAAYPWGTYDGLVSTDVLEHIPEEDIGWFLVEFFRLAGSFIFANIAGYPAEKVLPNGWNAHVTVKPKEWWKERIEEAARNWRGERYLFTYESIATGLRRRLRRLAGRPVETKVIAAQK